MRIEIDGDGKRLMVRVVVEWQRLKAFTKAVVATLTVVASLMTLLAQLGLFHML